MLRQRFNKIGYTLWSKTHPVKKGGAYSRSSSSGRSQIKVTC